MSHNAAGDTSPEWPAIFDDGDTFGFDPDVIAELSDMDPYRRIGHMADYLEGKARGGGEAVKDVFSMLRVAGVEDGSSELQRAAFVDYFGSFLLTHFGIQIVKPEEEA